METVSPNRLAWQRFCQNRAALGSGIYLSTLVLVLLVWPLLTAQAPDATSDTQFAAPNGLHWFGTDVHGRDLLTRVVYGARISLLVGAVGAGVSLVIGVLWGAFAGYIGGRCDSVLMRIVDVLYALPSIIFVIVLMTTLQGVFDRLKAAGWSGQGTATLQLLALFAGLGAVSWLTMARIVRGQVLSLRTRPFIEASRALGASHVRILSRHILPNVAGVVIVYLALTVPAVVLYESFLSYLGLGIQPPQASLGSLIAEGATQINPIRVYWWMILCPAGALATTLLALNCLGDGLRDALDPQAGPRRSAD
ncbi:MAG: ABC transporter permease [Verrucomicrobia bacterium]|nr:ABC transporter permease [Verrucomicrobiota bacterium]